MMMSLTSDCTRPLNAAPMMKPIAKSTRLPRRANSLNSLSIVASPWLLLLQRTIGRKSSNRLYGIIERRVDDPRQALTCQGLAYPVESPIEESRCRSFETPVFDSRAGARTSFRKAHGSDGIEWPWTHVRQPNLVVSVRRTRAARRRACSPDRDYEVWLSYVRPWPFNAVASMCFAE